MNQRVSTCGWKHSAAIAFALFPIIALTSACASRAGNAGDHVAQPSIGTSTANELRKLSLTESGAACSVDCGLAFPGEQRTYVFELQNDTGAAVHFKNIDNACKCITSAASFTDLAPGETGLVSVWFTYLPRFGTDEKTVTIYLTQNPANTGSEPKAINCKITFAWNIQELLVDDVTYIPKPPATGRPPPVIAVKRGEYPLAWDTFTAEDEKGLFATRIEAVASGWLIHLSPIGDIPPGGVTGLVKARFFNQGKPLAHATMLPYFVELP